MTKFTSYAKHNFRKIPQMEIVGENIKKDIEAVSSVLPFKVNNYVIENLIDWDNIPHDPIYTLTFPRREMLSKTHWNMLEKASAPNGTYRSEKDAIEAIRQSLNPHPANQEDNIPTLGQTKIEGIQHKYRETLLFFPSQGQTCHSYCTFCFRWPQFVSMDGVKFASNEANLLIEYLSHHPEVTDVLFTGGDPMVMKASLLKRYIQPILESKNNNVQNIRIGTKSLTYWPYRFTSDRDADDILRLFEEIVNSKNI